MQGRKVDFELIFVPIEDPHRNFEEDVRLFFERKGYFAKYSREMRWGDDGEIFWERGVPDLYIKNEDEEVFVEVKRRHDGLKGYQVEWIATHPSKRVILAYPKTGEEVI